ncbi:MAG: NADH-quinone oxidoreductase subunit J [Armatimonadota bacterium]|jgi:NADH-quinone oxidoreductase subunit J
MAVWLFDAVAVLLVLCAIAAILQRNPLHSALLLGVVFAGLAIPFVLCQAELLAALQIIIYAGAIIVLFVIVITMLGSGSREAVEEQLSLRPAGTICAVVMGILLAALLAGPAVWVLGRQRADAWPDLLSRNVQAFGTALFTGRYIIPIEITSLILLAAMVAVVVLVVRAPQGASDESATQAEDG